MKERPTVRIVSATEAKNRFGAMIKHAYSEQEHLIVERSGIPMVAIIPLTDYGRWLAAEDLPAEVAEAVVTGMRHQLAQRRFLEFLDQVQARMPEVSEEEGERDIQEAIQAIRRSSQ